MKEREVILGFPLRRRRHVKDEKCFSLYSKYKLLLAKEKSDSSDQWKYWWAGKWGTTVCRDNVVKIVESHK